MRRDYKMFIFGSNPELRTLNEEPARILIRHLRTTSIRLHFVRDEALAV